MTARILLDEFLSNGVKDLITARIIILFGRKERCIFERYRGFEEGAMETNVCLPDSPKCEPIHIWGLSTRTCNFVIQFLFFHSTRNDMTGTHTKVTEYQLHPYCVTIPEIDQKTFDELVEDIRRNGLNYPIVKYKEKILDGRSRFEACKKAGIKPRFIELEKICPAVKKAKNNAEKDNIALNWVISQNLHRRHLNESQRALIAAKLANLRVGQSKVNAQMIGIPTTTQGEAADEVDVSRKLVIQANKILKKYPAKVPAIESGKKTIGQVLNEIKKTEENRAYFGTLTMDESDRPRPKESIVDKPPFIDMVRSIDLNKSGTLTGKDFDENAKALSKLVAESAIGALVGHYVRACHLLDVLAKMTALTTELDVMIPFLDLERGLKIFEADKRDAYKWIKDVHQFRSVIYPRWHNALEKQAKTAKDRENLSAIEKQLSEVQAEDMDYMRDLAKSQCKVFSANVQNAQMGMYIGELVELADLGLDSNRVSNKKSQRAAQKRSEKQKRKLSK